MNKMKKKNEDSEKNDTIDEKIDDALEEIQPIKLPSFIELCEEYLLNVTNRFSNL